LVDRDALAAHAYSVARELAEEFAGLDQARHPDATCVARRIGHVDAQRMRAEADMHGVAGRGLVAQREMQLADAVDIQRQRVGTARAHLARQQVHRADEIGDEGVHRVVVERGRRAHLLHHALVEHGHAVGRGHRLFLVVGDEQRGQSEPPLHSQQLLAHLHAQRLVQIGQRFVQQQQLRLDDDGARQRHALLLPARQLVGPALRVAGQPHQLERGTDLGLDRSAGQAPLDQPEGDVVPHRQVRPQRVALEHHADVALPRRLAGDVDAVDQHLAALVLVEPGNQPQQRALA
jgi:hypothetical protein